MSEQILEILRESGQPMAAKSLAAELGVSVEAIQPALDALAREGLIVQTKKGRWMLSEAVGFIRARVSFQRNGTPVAHPLDGGEALPMRYDGADRCMPDDVALVRPDGAKYALHSILKRGREALAAYVRIERKAPKGGSRAEVRTIATAVPCDLRIPYDIVLTGDMSFVKNDEIAELKIERYPQFNRPIYASVMRVLGNSGSMIALMRAVAEDHGFATELPEAVEAEARALPMEVGADDLAGREDLRGLLAFTIDGATAKDFDDAVSVEAIDGGWRLGVHIADVSHYVRLGSAVDADAFARGTSLYLPGLTVPMLPEHLSNHLCSLMPDVDRLALTLFMDVKDGAVTDHRLVKSVIHSHARLTYEAVNRLFEGGEADIAPEVAGDLRQMRVLAGSLNRRRSARGSVDFDMDEPEFVLDERGEPVDVLCEPRGEAERMIEAFMLAANETVAQLARNTELPFVYRIHERPDADRLSALERFLSGVGLHAHIGAQPHPGVLQAILERAEAHPARDVIRHYLLRAMKKAQYSEKPAGHYALAMEDYCHFTSPIRRYPDLTVHRMLKMLIDGEPIDLPKHERAMPGIAAACSLRENAAVQAERQGDGIMMAAYMARQVGRKFDGVVSGVTGWGLYVTLPNGAEGLVHIAGLDDYYAYDADRSRLVGEATGTVFQLGDRVRVRMESAVVAAGEINFELLPPRRETVPGEL